MRTLLPSDEGSSVFKARGGRPWCPRATGSCLVQPGQRGPSHGMLCLEPGGLPLPDLQVPSRVCEVLRGAPHLAMPLVAGGSGQASRRKGRWRLRPSLKEPVGDRTGRVIALSTDWYL